MAGALGRIRVAAAVVACDVPGAPDRVRADGAAAPSGSCRSDRRGRGSVRAPSPRSSWDSGRRSRPRCVPGWSCWTSTGSSAARKQRFGCRRARRGGSCPCGCRTPGGAGTDCGLGATWNAGQAGRPAASAVEALDGWWESPRHAAITEFRTPARTAAAVEALRDWHVTVVQLYDWMYRHYRYAPPSGAATFIDAARAARLARRGPGRRTGGSRCRDRQPCLRLRVRRGTRVRRRATPTSACSTIPERR